MPRPSAVDLRARLRPPATKGANSTVPSTIVPTFESQKRACLRPVFGTQPRALTAGARSNQAHPHWHFLVRAHRLRSDRPPAWSGGTSRLAARCHRGTAPMMNKSRHSLCGSVPADHPSGRLRALSRRSITRARGARLRLAHAPQCPSDFTIVVQHDNGTARNRERSDQASDVRHASDGSDSAISVRPERVRFPPHCQTWAGAALRSVLRRKQTGANFRHRRSLADVWLYSMTSLASINTVAGTVSPMALAAFRFTTSSNLVANWTGKLAGRSPRRIRST
jgi:hypothetical protein